MMKTFIILFIYYLNIYIDHNKNVYNFIVQNTYFV